MLIICTDYEKEKMKEQCVERCSSCIFKDIACPIEEDDIVTLDEIKDRHNILFGK